MTSEYEVPVQPVGWHIALEKAQHFLSIERYDLAKRELETVLTAEPSNELAHVLMGYVALGQKQLVDADGEARSALALDPESAAAKVLLGRVCIERGKHVEAEKWYLDALQANPQDAHTLYLYAALMLRTSHLEKAEQLCRASLALRPNDNNCHSLLSAIHTAKEETRSAAKHGRHALGLSPESDFSHYALGLALYNGWHPFRARQHLREAVRIDPSNSDVIEAYHAVDLACRWTYLPMYFGSRVLNRIPGKQFAVWAVVVIGGRFLRQKPELNTAMTYVLLGWVAFCLYSWVAMPLTKAWVKVVPPR